MRIAVVGSDGIPARYGGFETFVEQVAPRWVALGHQVIVVGSSVGRNLRAPLTPGVRAVYLPIRANGAASVLYDFVSFFRILSLSDAVLLLGVSAGLFVPVFSMSCGRRKLVVNVDGLESRRDKWRGLQRWFLTVSEQVAIRHAPVVITDNEGLANFLARKYDRQSTTIAYGHDHVLKLGDTEVATLLHSIGLSPGGYALSIARIEPENNIDMMIRACLATPEMRYVVVGNFEGSAYGRNLLQSYGDESRIRLQCATYDPRLLAALRAGCSAYLHGHSVGGTNPSLVEVLPYRKPTLAFDCVFNRCTLRQQGGYFSDADMLTAQLSGDLEPYRLPKALADDPLYHWREIARRYLEALTPHEK